MAGIGDIVTELGGAVGSLFTSQGNAAEAASYTGAAQLEQQNAQLTAASTRIQSTQIARQVSQSLGTTQADVAGAGFTESGSALDILRSSAQQGSLASSLVNINGAINENAYAAQSGADLAKAKAANEANTASTIQAIASVGGALVNNYGQLASAGKTVASGIESITSGDPLAAASAEELGAANDLGDFGGDLAMSATDQSITDAAAIDTSAPSILGAEAADVSAEAADVAAGDVAAEGVGDFVVGDAVAADAAAAAGVGDAVAADVGGSILGDVGDAVLAAVAC